MCVVQRQERTHTRTGLPTHSDNTQWCAPCMTICCCCGDTHLQVPIDEKSLKALEQEPSKVQELVSMFQADGTHTHSTPQHTHLLQAHCTLRIMRTRMASLPMYCTMQCVACAFCAHVCAEELYMRVCVCMTPCVCRERASDAEQCSATGQGATHQGLQVCLGCTHTHTHTDTHTRTHTHTQQIYV